MNIGRMGQARTHDNTHDHAHNHSQDNAQQIEADGFRMGITNQQIGNDGCHASGEEHCVHIGIPLFLLDEVCHHNAQHGKPHIEHMDAPGAEAYRQEECQGGHIVHLGLSHMEQTGDDQRNQAHIQEGSREAANGEVVGGNLTGLAEDLPEAGEHSAAVGHADSCHQKGNTHKGKQKLQKAAFR